MKKFMLLHQGFVMPDDQLMADWNAWFESISGIQIDQGGFAGGTEITKEGTKELPWDLDSITGYNIITAIDRDAAVEIAKRNPFVSSIRVYELR